MKQNRSYGIEKISYATREAAGAIGLSEGTLSNLRSRKAGPRYYKVGRKVLYLHTDLVQWLTRNPIFTNINDEKKPSISKRSCRFA